MERVPCFTELYSVLESSLLTEDEMSMKQKRLCDEYVEVIDAGDLDKLRALHQGGNPFMGYAMAGNAGTPRIFATALNATKKDPIKLQRDIVARILCMQFTLLERVEKDIFDIIGKYDSRHNGYELPGVVTSELLPRYGKISSEIFTTMKMFRKIGVSSSSAESDAPAENA